MRTAAWYINHKLQPPKAFFEWCLKQLPVYHWYRYRSEIEFLQKIKATALAEAVYFGQNVDMRVINQRWLRENKQYFRKSDREFLEFELERRIKARHGKVVPGIQKYLRFNDIKKIPQGIGMVRFQNWVIKYKVNFEYYKDYLGLLKDLNIDPTGDENLITPKDLIKAHDNAVELLNQLKREKERLENEKRQAEYMETLKRRKRLEGECEGYLFKLPATLNDLIVEGKELHHCVGSSRYVEEHSKGKTTIIFVRKQAEPDKPFYTLEYQGGRIIQIRGKHNQEPPQEVAEAAEEWRERNDQKNSRLAKC